MPAFALDIFSTNFMPHGHCYYWRPEIVWSHALSDAIIAISYFIIPYGLIKLIRRRPDLKYKNLFFLFGVFIVACGTTHILSIINIWTPMYRLDALVKIITALASLPTAIILIRIIPQAVKIPSLAVFESMNKSLQDQIETLKEKDKTIEKVKEFEFLADSIPQIIWTAQPDGNLDYFNKHWYEYTGLTTKQSIGWAWQPVLHPEDLENDMKVWKHSIATGEPYEAEYRIKRANDSQFRWHLGRAVAMRDDKGKIVRWFGACTDVHDLKTAQEKVNEVSERFQTLINNAPVIIWAVDTEGKYTFSEGKSLESINLKPSEMVGKSSFDFLRNAPSSWQANIQRALSGEVFNDVNDFNSVSFETNFSPMRNAAGEITGMVGISLDITKRKKAETESQFKSRFLASMSHEIRTPLNAVIGFANILKRTELNEDQKKYVLLINQSGELLLKLIGDVLDLSKIEEGKITIEEESFPLRETINSTLHPYKFRAQESGVDFTILFDGDLPNYLIGDKTRINQVLINLIGNALKFTKKGKIEVRIEKAGEVGQEVPIRFSVCDSGIGIAEKKQQEIFNSFTQASSTIHKEFGGSGLGLSIAKQLVSLMGGHLQVDSPHHYFPEPTGSCFWFILPLKVDTSPKTVEIVPKEELSFHNRIKVLVVEDNSVNQILAKIVLKNIGCQIDFANNGQDCLDILSNSPETYACILMDIQMPVMDGIETTMIIRNKYQNSIPIIGLSANVYKEDIERSLLAGMNNHIGKPYSEEQIYYSIKKSIDAALD